MMYDAGNAKHVEERAKKSKLFQRQLDEHLKSVLSTNVGRAWFFDLLGRCRLFQTSFNTDPGRMAFDEGQRNIGLMLQAEIGRVYPEAFTLMMREANERDSERDTSPGSGDTSSGDSEPDGGNSGSTES